MKRLGLVGGSGWPSTLEYYRLLNSYYCEKRGLDRAMDLVLRNVDFAQFRILFSEGKKSEALHMLSEAIEDCQNAGAEFLAFSANGLHRFIEEVKESIRLPFVHIADATAQHIKKREFKVVGLLGVKATMEGDFYPSRLNKLEIKMFIPEALERERLDKIIFSELVQNKFTEPSRDIFLGAINELVKKGAEAVILGCTEIPLLIKEGDTDVPLIPTTEIHCAAIVEKALSD